MAKRRLDQPSLFDSPVCTTVLEESPVDLRAVIRQEQERDMSWMFTCQECLHGRHSCGMQFCRCVTCGGGARA